MDVMAQDTVEENQNEKSRIEQLEQEKQRIQEEFNGQRAKMKNLLLQKEDELERKLQENQILTAQVQKLQNEIDDVKSQLVVNSMIRESNFEVEKRKAEEEIATLQRLVHETVEESSSTRTLYDNELTKLQSYIQQLQNEIALLKREKAQTPPQTSQEHSLAPSVVLNALTKGIVKKLGADTFTSQDVDDSTKKCQDDVDDLRSLVEPLEDQIKALKEKLRATDEQLQRCKECGHKPTEKDVLDQSSQHVNMQLTTATNTSFESQKYDTLCAMCSNYEAQLVKEQKRTADFEAKVLAAEKAAERHKEDLLKEIGFRKEMEEKWNEKKEEHKQQVAELMRVTECTEQDLKELREAFVQACTKMREDLCRLTRERDEVYRHLNKLQAENDNLVGKYMMHSQELQNQEINLPNTVEELHELVLRTQEELIRVKIGKETADEKAEAMQSELVLLQSERDSLNLEIRNLRKDIDKIEKEKLTYKENHEKLMNSGKASQIKLSEMQEKIEELNNNVKQLETQNSELKSRVHSMQKDLNEAEIVQKDFVKLSQSLQIQLEQIRESDVQVRWQYEDDVEECPACRQSFAQSGRRKEHCRHCGRIFCDTTCLSRTVASGPRMRPSKVCDVCHTLLVKSSAPYFSEAPPMT